MSVCRVLYVCMHRVTEFRNKYGWSKMELATKADLSDKLIYDIENNKNYNCNRKTMIKISSAFNLPPSIIFFSEEEIEKRKMLSAVIAIVTQIMMEKDFWQTMDQINSLRETSPQNADQQDTVRIRAVLSSSGDQS